ncbi:aconitate hydratase AcnA [bacterium]|nr:aconitate hydratase AcnA [bacterium]
MPAHDPFGAFSTLAAGDLGDVSYYRLQALEEAGLGSLSRLPFSIRVLLESVLRNQDGLSFTEEHVKALTGWKPNDSERAEIPYKPARVVLQDFTGVPAVVDLAAMRDAIKRLGGDPQRINPLVRCDLVIDHSVQVDHYASPNALELNEKIEFARNKERYEFLKWGQGAFKNFRVVPPSTGIVHQVNLEYLSEVAYHHEESSLVYPDSCVGTDSHTPMVNGLGVVAWGVGGIEAEAVMLNQPIVMLIPDVVGIKIVGELPEGATATDLVLRVTEMCRELGVVGKFVEFYGPGLAQMTIADRATLGNMAPEQGSTVSFSPVDDVTLDYMRATARKKETVELTERYYKEQGLFRTADTPDPEFSATLELDLSTIEPAVAGPKRPQDRVALSSLKTEYPKMVTSPVGPQGLGRPESELTKEVSLTVDGKESSLETGAVVIAAITSCTNTSNPSVMLAAGLVAKKALEKGLSVPPYVKTSLAPGSRVVTEYLEKSGLDKDLDRLGFHTVGYGCTTCIGNSGPLQPEIEEAIKKEDLVVSAVLSGNRNFEGRVHPLTQTNFLASPPLVVAFALAGNTNRDLTRDPIGTGSDGAEVFLKDIWPSNQEIEEAVRSFITVAMFRERYGEVFQGSKAWQAIEAGSGELYEWKDDSTYVQNPPFFDSVTKEKGEIAPISGARVLGLFGDSVTTDHISPAGNIAKSSPAARYLEGEGVPAGEYNSYGSRRGNDRVMVRGTFANIRIKNRLVPGSEGNHSVHHPSGTQASFFEVAEMYQKEKTPLLILAGKEYGSGSSRDWAAKGPYLQGVKAVIAESYERIHRSNLIGMGILPLQFLPGESAETHGLTGTEHYTIEISDNTKPGEEILVKAVTEDGAEKSFPVQSRIDTPMEVQYMRDGGILCTVLKNLAKEG